MSTPDMSFLTLQERKIIEAVMRREEEESVKDNVVGKRKRASDSNPLFVSGSRRSMDAISLTNMNISPSTQSLQTSASKGVSTFTSLLPTILRPSDKEEDKKSGSSLGILPADDLLGSAKSHISSLTSKVLGQPSTTNVSTSLTSSTVTTQGMSNATGRDQTQITVSGEYSSLCELCKKTLLTNANRRKCLLCHRVLCFRCGLLGRRNTPTTSNSSIEDEWACHQCMRSPDIRSSGWRPHRSAAMQDQQFSSKQSQRTQSNAPRVNPTETRRTRSESFLENDDEIPRSKRRDYPQMGGESQQYTHQTLTYRRSESPRTDNFDRGYGMREDPNIPINLARRSHTNTPTPMPRRHLPRPLSGSYELSGSPVPYTENSTPRSLQGVHSSQMVENGVSSGRLCEPQRQRGRTQKTEKGKHDLGYDNSLYGHNSARMKTPTPNMAQGYYTAENLSSLHHQQQQHYVSWKTSADGNYLRGHMILKKENRMPSAGGRESGGILGLKITGGLMTPSGRLGAFVMDVKSGSAADVIGQLKPGDEVLEWNGKPIHGLTYDDVHGVISDSRNDDQIELLVQRLYDVAGDARKQTPLHKMEIPLFSQRALTKYHDPEPTHTSYPTIQVRIGYDKSAKELLVTVVRATRLDALHSTSSLCNSFFRLVLQPERSPLHRYQSRVISSCNDPLWNKCVYFPNIQENEVRLRNLEVSMWDADPSLEECRLIGEIVIDLSTTDLTERLQEYYLTPTNYTKRPHSRQPLFNELERSQSPHSRHGADRIYFRRGSHEPEQSINSSPLMPSRTQIFSNRNNSADRGARYRDDVFVYSDKYRKKGREDFSRPKTGAYISRDESNHSSLYKMSMENGSFDSSDTSKLSSYSLKQYSKEGALSTDQGGSHIPKQESSQHRNNYPKPHSSSIDDYAVEEMYESESVGSISERVQSVTPMTSQEANFEDDELLSLGGYPSADGKIAPISDSGASSEAAIGASATNNSRVVVGRKFNNALGLSKKAAPIPERKSKYSIARSEEVAPVTSSHRSHRHHHERVEVPPPEPEMSADPSCYPRELPSTRPMEDPSRDLQMSGSNDVMGDEVGGFVDGLGPGQVVGRQVLGMTPLGDIQMSFFDRSGKLEVEVIRARNLRVPVRSSYSRSTSRRGMVDGRCLPQPYVKLYLMNSMAVAEKQRTLNPVRATLDPLFQEQIIFRASYHGKLLQVSIWGDFGKMEKKAFMGMCEIQLDQLDLSSIVFGWYKLYGLIGASVKPLYTSSASHTN